MLRLLIQLLWLIYFVLYFGWLTVPHGTPLSGARRLKGLATELCGPSDQDLVTLPLWQATRGLRSLWCLAQGVTFFFFRSAFIEEYVNKAGLSSSVVVDNRKPQLSPWCSFICFLSLRGQTKHASVYVIDKHTDVVLSLIGLVSMCPHYHGDQTA